MSEDVLKKWATTIREAEWISKRQPFVGSDCLCIADLVAALREERERVAELEEQLEARIAELASVGDGE